jgi:hypothetical protein
MPAAPRRHANRAHRADEKRVTCQTPARRVDGPARNECVNGTLGCEPGDGRATVRRVGTMKGLDFARIRLGAPARMPAGAAEIVVLHAICGVQLWSCRAGTAYAFYPRLKNPDG